jgi:serine/threonine protein kinase/formylglycine-generating enzyme required for sulfatase activity
MIRIDRGDETLDQEYSTLWSGHGDGPEPSVFDFLAHHPDASPSERSDVLLADQWLRWRCGRPKTVGDYLAEHPSLADDPEAILKLVQGEFLARLDRGEAPEPDSYARMFPALAEPILLQCEVDRWLTMPAPPETSMSMATTAEYRVGAGAERAEEDETDDGTRPDSASGQSAALEAPLPEADFELVRPLGSGGMGEVYEAIQKSLRKRVALKLIRREALDSPSRVRRFFAEARASARLHHPQIVGVHGIGRMADGRYFLVMDLIEDGTTLAALLRQGPVPFDRAAELVATVAEAIEHAHSRGVVHRDLKPSNVLLDAEDWPHVTDFGLAKIIDTADPDHPPTTADQILGTPHYMTPEQADPARGPIGPRTDVYAMGGLLYTLLTGKPPIQGDSLTAILTRIVSPEPVPSPRALRANVPAGLERICATCLEKDAENRYPSAGAVAEALRTWLANPEVEGPASVQASPEQPRAGSGAEADPSRSRGDWARDRSLKNGPRTTNPGRWSPKAARFTRVRRRVWEAVAVASTLALLLIAGSHFRSHTEPPDNPSTKKGEIGETAVLESPDVKPAATRFWAPSGYEPLTAQRVESFALGKGKDFAPGKPGSDLGDAPAGLKDKQTGEVFYAFAPGVYLPLGYLPDDPNDTVGSWPKVLVRTSDQVRFIRITGKTYDAGDFRAATPAGDIPHGNPIQLHEVKVASFYIQETEVTNKEIREYHKEFPDEFKAEEWDKFCVFLASDVRMKPEDVDRCPAVGIDRATAQRYARWVWGRLPTEAEWEFAARSEGKHHRWACSSAISTKKTSPKARLVAAFGDAPLSPLPVKSFPEDQTDQKVFDMTGNVQEWCLDAYRPYADIAAIKSPGQPWQDLPVGDEPDPANPKAEYVARGGSYLVSANDATVFQRNAVSADSQLNYLGFRVVIPCPPEITGPGD